MYQEFYRTSELLHLPLLALLLFLAVFVGVVVRVFVYGRKDNTFDRLAQIPFSAERAGGNRDE